MLHLMAKHPDFDLLIGNFNEWVMMTLSTDDRFATTMKIQPKNYITIKERYGKPFLVVMGERGLTAGQSATLLPMDDWHWRALAEARRRADGGRSASLPLSGACRACACGKVYEFCKKLATASD